MKKLLFIALILMSVKCFAREPVDTTFHNVITSRFIYSTADTSLRVWLGSKWDTLKLAQPGDTVKITDFLTKYQALSYLMKKDTTQNRYGYIPFYRYQLLRLLNNHDSLSKLDEKSYLSLTDKPTVSTFPLANDQWYPVYDYAGNLTNGWKKSKDNIFEFAGILGINSFYHVLNPGINEIVNIPLSTASTTGTEHGVAMTVGGNKIMKVSAKVSATGTADSTRVTLSTGTMLGFGKNAKASIDIEAGTTVRAAIKFTTGDTLTIRQPGTIGYKGTSFYINDNLILSGKTTIGSTVQPTAKLMLGAGNTSTNSGPLKFNSGALTTTPEVGAVEFLNDKWYGTITTGVARKTFAFLERPNFIDSIRTPVGRFTTGAGVGKIAKSDATGVLVWSDPDTYYLGTWNATTNTPTIANGTGTAGQWYRTVVKGVWGADSARVGSDVFYSGTVWQVIPNATFFLQQMTKTVLGGGKIDSFTIKYNGSGQLQVDTADTKILGRGRAANTYEPKIVHNTGFNLNLGTAGGTVLEGRTFGTAANSATGDFVAYRTFGTAANNNTGDFQPIKADYESAVTSGVVTYSLPFILRSTALVIYNNQVLENDRWTGSGTTSITLYIDPMTYDYIKIQN